MSRDNYKGVPTRSYEVSDRHRGPLYATRTRAVEHYYLDGTSGDDANSGLSASEPIKTFERLDEIVPRFIDHHTVVHLSGNIVVPYSWTQLLSGRTIGAYVLIDGGTDVTVVDDNGGANYTATGNGTNQFTVSGAGWSENTFKRTEVEILSGDLAGYRVSCWGNTTETLSLGTMPSAPGNVDFRFVKPLTTISGTSGEFLSLMGNNYSRAADNTDGVGMHLTNIRLVGNLGFYIEKCTCGPSFMNFHINTTSSTPMNAQACTLYASGGKWDSTTLDRTYTPYVFGLVSTSTSAMTLMDVISSYLYGSSIAGAVNIHNFPRSSYCVGSSTNIDGKVSVYGSQSLKIVAAGTNFGPQTTINGGLYIQNHASCGTSDIDTAAVINNASGPAVEVVGSNIRVGAFTGGGSTFGMYAHNGSAISLTAAPTVSGTTGFLTFDGTTTCSGVSWASIAAGGNIWDIPEMTIVKPA